MPNANPINPATYQAACELVANIDHHLTTNTGHYFDTAGARLWTLDQVVLAIIENRLAVAPPQSPPQGGRQNAPLPVGGQREEWGGLLPATQGATQ